MTIENITKEDFRAYKQAKENQIYSEEIKSSLGSEYWLGALSATSTVVFGAVSLLNFYSGEQIMASGFDVGLTLFSGAIFGYMGKEIIKKYKKLGKLEGELEKIKQNTLYEELEDL